MLRIFGTFIAMIGVGAATYYGLGYRFPVQPQDLRTVQPPSVEEVLRAPLVPAPIKDNVRLTVPDGVLADTAAIAEDATLDDLADLDMLGADEGTADALPAVEPVEPDPIVAVAPPPAPKPAPQPQPKPAPKPAPTPAPKPAEPAPAPEKIAAWWGKENPQALSVVYAGSASYTRAVVLLFNGSFADSASANSHVRVKDARGRALNGSWQINPKNPRMLVFPVAAAGRYEVEVGSGLRDRSGKQLGAAVRGPVLIP